MYLAMRQTLSLDAGPSYDDLVNEWRLRATREGLYSKTDSDELTEEEAARDYDKLVTVSTRALLDYLPLTQNPIGRRPLILDVGQGIGGHAIAWSRFGRVYCVDISQEMQQVARDRILTEGVNSDEESVSFAITPSYRLSCDSGGPFRVGFFEAVHYGRELLHVVNGEQWYRSIREGVDVLRPGGLLIIFETMQDRNPRYQLQPHKSQWTHIRHSRDYRGVIQTIGIETNQEITLLTQPLHYKFTKEWRTLLVFQIKPLWPRDS
jgi:SAM-dependent methyltransferase